MPAAPEPQETRSRKAERRTRRTRLTVGLLGIAGLGLAVALVVHGGAADIFHVLAVGGWALLWLIPFHILVVAAEAQSWRLLLPEETAATLPVLVWIAAVRDSCTALLPFGGVGGELLALQMLMKRGITGSKAGASLVVGLTVTLAAQFLFTLAGVGLLVYGLGDRALAETVLIALGVSLPVILVFFLLQQRWGLFGLVERVLAAIRGREMLAAIGDPERLDGAIQALYRDRVAIAACLFWQLAALAASTAELWLTFHLLGQSLDLAVLVILESLSHAVLSATFVVPASLGTLEGSFTLFGAAVGLGPDVALAAALARRLRQVGFGIPSFISWQWDQGWSLVRLLHGDTPADDGGREATPADPGEAGGSRAGGAGPA